MEKKPLLLNPKVPGPEPATKKTEEGTGARRLVLRREPRKEAGDGMKE